MPISELGKNIKLFREKKGWNLKKLIDEADVGYATIHDIENGKKQNINSTTLEKIASALDISPNELLGIDITEHTVSDMFETINVIFESDEIEIDNIQLTPKEKDILKKIYIDGIDIIRLMRDNQ